MITPYKTYAINLAAFVAVVQFVAGFSIAQVHKSVNQNLVTNAGFERRVASENGVGLPANWRTHVGKGKAEFATVSSNPHSGESCAMVRAKAPNSSGYWVSQKISVEGGHKYNFRCWYRTPYLETVNRGIFFSMNFRRADGSPCDWPNIAATSFSKYWAKMEFTGIADDDATSVRLVIGLADSEGELLVDDVYFANTGKAEYHNLNRPTDNVIARPFPQTWLPDDHSIGLIQGHVQPLLFLIQNAKKRIVSNPALGLLLPQGIEVVGGDRSTKPASPIGTRVYDGKDFFGWLQPVEGNRHMEAQFNYYRGVLVALRTNLSPGMYQAYCFFDSDEETEEPHPITIRVLPPLPKAPVLHRFHIGLLLADAFRAGGEALEGFANMYAATGMNLAIWDLNPDPTELSRYFKRHGILRHFLMPGQGVVYDVAYGNKNPEIAITDAKGKVNLTGLCPTYIRQRGEHFEKACLENIVARWVRADVMDGFAINWEPPGQFLAQNYCWDDRCLLAMSKESGIALERLKQLGPSKILDRYKIQWMRFRAKTEGQIAKTYFDKLRELETEVKRPLMWYPLTSPRRFDPSRPAQDKIDSVLLRGDVEHPHYYRNHIDAYGPFTYTAYDVLAKRWYGRHDGTLRNAREAVAFANANAPDGRNARPVWFGIEGIQKGSRKALCWATTPRQMEMEIIGALAEGCQGIYIYTGRGMDGHFYSAAARAVQRAALLETFVNKPLPGRVKLSKVHRYIRPEPVTGLDSDHSLSHDANGHIRSEQFDPISLARLFGNQNRYLLVLAGLHCERAVDLLLSVDGLVGGKWKITDPVTGQAMKDPSVDAATLSVGVLVTLGPGDLHTYLIERQ